MPCQPVSSSGIEALDSLLPQLSAAVERHITELGVADFVVGSYGWFDSMAARTVKAAKKHHPEVTLTLLLHYHLYDRPIPTPDGFDSTFYPPRMETVPKRAAIVRANRYMAEHSDYLIAYAWHPASNARELVEYARKREKRGLLQITELRKDSGVEELQTQQKERFLIMSAIYKHHPKRSKNCVFCKFWIGDAKMKFVNSAVGYEYDGSTNGKCTKRNGAATPACYSCPNYVPSQDAEKLL